MWNAENFKKLGPYAGALTGLGAATALIPQYSQMSDGTYDLGTGFGALGGGLGGAGIGALAGHMIGSNAANKLANYESANRMHQQIMALNPGDSSEIQKFIANRKAAQSKFPMVDVPDGAALLKKGAPKELNAITKLLGKNPQLLAGAGGLLGLTMGASILGKALKGPKEAELAQQQAYWQQKNAQDLALANAQAYPTYSTKSGGYY